MDLPVIFQNFCEPLGPCFNTEKKGEKLRKRKRGKIEKKTHLPGPTCQPVGFLLSQLARRRVHRRRPYRRLCRPAHRGDDLIFSRALSCLLSLSLSLALFLVPYLPHRAAIADRACARRRAAAPTHLPPNREYEWHPKVPRKTP